MPKAPKRTAVLACAAMAAAGLAACGTTAPLKERLELQAVANGQGTAPAGATDSATATGPQVTDVPGGGAATGTPTMTSTAIQNGSSHSSTRAAAAPPTAYVARFDMAQPSVHGTGGIAPGRARHPRLVVRGRLIPTRIAPERFPRASARRAGAGAPDSPHAP